MNIGPKAISQTCILACLETSLWRPGGAWGKNCLGNMSRVIPLNQMSGAKNAGSNKPNIWQTNRWPFDFSWFL